jgi:AraC family transcriptional regulator, exoenzyme S synthesis regulatory protein ExsA
MKPYTHSDRKSSLGMVDLKLREGIQAILDVEPTSPAVLFDFLDPWKIDLNDFMEENYLEEMPVEELAAYSGRSLSGFKRDFKKISDLTPERWIMQRRLHDAQEMINEGMKVSDFYLDLGFKNLSHFSQAYKHRYGHAQSIQS